MKLGLYWTWGGRVRGEPTSSAGHRGANCFQSVFLAYPDNLWVLTLTMNVTCTQPRPAIKVVGGLMYLCMSRGDGVIEALVKLIQDFLCGSLQKYRAGYLVRGIKGLPPNLGFQVRAGLATKTDWGHKVFLAALQKWQENGSRLSAKGLERQNHCGRWPD